jgi:hypothetical protein
MTKNIAIADGWRRAGEVPRASIFRPDAEDTLDASGPPLTLYDVCNDYSLETSTLDTLDMVSGSPLYDWRAVGAGFLGVHKLHRETHYWISPDHTLDGAYLPVSENFAA